MSAPGGTGTDLDDFGGALPSAHPVRLNSFGFGIQLGRINPQGDTRGPDVDMFRYDAPATRLIEVRLTPRPGEDFVPDLTVLDAQGAQLRPTGAELRPFSELSLKVSAGQTFYFQVAAFQPGQTGDYQLEFEDYGDDLAHAFLINAPATGGEFHQDGTINDASDVDVFEFQAPITGLLYGRAAPVGGSVLADRLTVWDASGTAIAGGSGGGSTATALAVTAGQTYYAGVSAPLTGVVATDTGLYRLTLVVTPRNAGHDFNSATSLAVAGDGLPAQLGAIAAPGVRNVYRFIAPATTSLTVREEASSVSDLDPVLSIYDASQRLIAQSDDFEIKSDNPPTPSASQVRVAVVAGETYFVSAAGFGSSTGVFALTAVPDDFGDTFATAQTIVLNPSSETVQPGIIESPGDVDFFRFQAPLTGGLEIRQDQRSGGLDSFLEVYDSRGTLLNFNDDGAEPDVGLRRSNPTNSRLTLNVTLGQTYFVRASAFPNPSGRGSYGAYALLFQPVPAVSADDYGNTLADAFPVSISAGFARLTGAIGTPDDVDMFQFTASRHESIIVRLDPASQSAIQGYLYALDSSGNVLATDYDDSLLDGRSNSDIQFNVQPGRVYYLRVAAFRTHVGSYDLAFSEAAFVPSQVDDHGGTLETATPIALAQDGATTVSGRIGIPEDVDLFRINAPRTEDLVVRMFAAPGSRLDTFLFAFNDSGEHLAESDDADSLFFDNRGQPVGPTDPPVHVLDRNSLLRLHVVAGKTYYLQATGFGASTGAYTISIVPTVHADGTPVDDTGDTIGDVRGPDGIPRHEQARSIGLASGTAVVHGAIEVPGDLDAFRFVAPETGIVEVTENASPGSPLDAELFAFGSGREPLGTNDDSHGSFNSLLRFNVQAHATYYLKAGAHGVSTGSYILTIDSIPASYTGAPGQGFATATTIDITAGGANVLGSINSPGAQNVFRFLAPFSGLLVVSQSATDGSALDSFLYAYDGQANDFDGLAGLITSDDDSGGGFDSLIHFNVTAGQSYFLRATGFGSSIGPYALNIRRGAAATVVSPSASLASAEPISLDSDGTADISGAIVTPGGADFYRFVAPYTGLLTIRQNAPSAGTAQDKSAPSKSILDCFLEVFDAQAQQVGANDDDGQSLNSRVALVVTAGNAYYVRAAGSGGSTGRYDLLFNDDYANSFDGASLIRISDKLLTSDVSGAIETSADNDMFRFVAPLTGPLVLRQERTAGSQLDSYLFVFDDSRRLLASNDDATVPSAVGGPGLMLPDSEVILNVIAGQSYFIRAASSSNTPSPDRKQTGQYRLSFSFLDDDFGNVFSDARTLIITPTRSVTEGGTIEVPGDVDAFQFLAPISGQMDIQMSAVGADLDGMLIAYDSTLNEVARNDDASPTTRDSHLRIDVRAGDLYYIAATAYGVSAGAYQLRVTPVPADDYGNDLGSAHSLEVSPSGTASVAGEINYPGDIDVFQYTAPVNGLLTAQVHGGPGIGLRLRVFAIVDGQPTQVAGDNMLPGLALNLEQGRDYFVAVDAPSNATGRYVLELRIEGPSPHVVAINRAGKETFLELRKRFVAAVTDQGQNSEQLHETVESISDDLVRQFISSEGGVLNSNYLLIWLDPVDFILTNPQARQSGYTTDRGRVDEMAGSFFSGSGDLKLLITPYTSLGHYELSLVGAGADPVLFGARIIRANGESVEPTIAPPPEVPVPALAPKAILVSILDSPAVSDPAPALTSQPDPAEAASPPQPGVLAILSTSVPTTPIVSPQAEGQILSPPLSPEATPSASPLGQAAALGLLTLVTNLSPQGITPGPVPAPALLPPLAIQWIKGLADTAVIRLPFARELVEGVYDTLDDLLSLLGHTAGAAGQDWRARRSSSDAKNPTRVPHAGILPSSRPLRQAPDTIEQGLVSGELCGVRNSGLRESPANSRAAGSPGGWAVDGRLAGTNDAGRIGRSSLPVRQESDDRDTRGPMTMLGLAMGTLQLSETTSRPRGAPRHPAPPRRF